MNHWLVKQEPEDYSFTQFSKDKHTDWTGVRNFQARNFLREMKVGDAVLYYHSGGERAVVGTAKVVREAFSDPTMEADEEKGAWVAVELQAGKALTRALTLAEIKADPELKKLLLITHSRLSVMSVSAGEYTHILRVTAAGGRTIE